MQKWLRYRYKAMGSHHQNQPAAWRTPMYSAGKVQHMHRLGFISLTAACLFAGNAQAQYPYNQNPNPAAIVGGILGGILRSIPAQQPQPTYAAQPQQGYVQQAAPQPNPQVQQQIEEQHRQAAAAAEERAKQRQQADADAKTKQRQAELKALADGKAKADAEEKKSRETAQKLRADPALVAVLGANPRDITALTVGKDTQVVIRNMEGNPVFQSPPIACFPFGGLTTQPGSPEMRFLAGVMADIASKGGLQGASITPRVCDPSDIGRYDLVIFSSDQVAAGSPDVLSALVGALGSRQLVAFGTFTVADFDAAEKAKTEATQAEQARKEAERKAARDSFQSRDPTVISAIHLESPATVVCLMASDPDGVRYMLKRSDSPFAGLVNANSALLPAPTADAIFIDLKKHDCVAAIAPAGALKEIVAAFARQNIPMEIDSGTLNSERLANWKILAEQDLLDAQADQARRLQKQREEDAAQQAEAARKVALEAERQKNDEAARQVRIQEMRKQVASKAQAVVDGITDQIRGLMNVVRDEIAAKQTPTKQPLSVFQPWADQYATQIKQGWEFQPINATIEDYGRAQWMHRTIEAISVRVEFPMLNRVIGERQTSCVDFVWINDEEFELPRNPITVPCDRYGPVFSAWSEQNSFASQWKLLN